MSVVAAKVYDDRIVMSADSILTNGYEKEPNINLELVNHPMVSPTPHLGASTVEAQERIGREIVKIIYNFLVEEKVIDDDMQIAL